MADMENEEASRTSGDECCDIGVLGQVVATRGGEPLKLGGPKQLCVLAVLVVAAPRVVTAGELAQAVYGDDVPESGRRRVQTYVSILRSIFGDVIIRKGDGWVFLIEAGSVDSIRFEQMVVRSSGLRAAKASALLSEALKLWRGTPFSGIESHGHLDAEVARLEELHLLALERRVDADLEQGRAADLVPELAALVVEHPYRESLRSRHMIALYRSGRQQEALASFDSLRVLLLEDLGVDPTPELCDLEMQILHQDQRLEASEELEGEPLRGYRLLEGIGGGLFSVVWRGMQPSIGREVAIKQIRSELADRPAFIRCFEAEALVIARVQHPHIVPLIDYWRDSDGAYLVMRWLSGGTVEQSLFDGAWAVERTLKMARQIGEALAHAHARGVVHRDVATSNILLDENGNAFLGDFGIALDAIETAGADGVTSPDSLPYVAPEQLRNEPLDPRTDIFSLAVVIYECLVGTRPFGEKNTDAELIRRQLTEPHPRLSEVQPEIAGHIVDAVARATSTSPADRFDAVLEFVEALEGSVAGTSSESVSTRLDETKGEFANPYKGLRTFDEPDAAEFFGRARLVDDLIEKLGSDDVGSRCLTVVGPSGSGKSSVVRAGLLPALRRDAIAGSADWYLTTMVPGAQPFKALEAALRRVATNAPPTLLHQLESGPMGILEGALSCLPTNDATIVVVIDQLEELFSSAPVDKADAFLSAIAAAVSGPASPLRVVATLRADYFDRPLAHPTFAAVLNAGTVGVTPLAPDELEAAIVQPARQHGVEFEPGLVARIAADAQGQAGSLPLLQYAMADLFERRSGTTLTNGSYEDGGALAGALAMRADELYSSGTAEERNSTRQVFGRLVDSSALATARSSLRRRVLRSDFGDESATASVIDRFAAARLLTFDRDPVNREQTVEVAHEALLREWPRLTQWLEDDRALLASVAHVGRSADSWDEGGHEPTDLYRGSRLVAAKEVTASSPERLRKLDRDFINASISQAEAERTIEQQRVSRLKRLVSGVAVALIVALIAGGVALQQRSQAADRAVEASARGLAAQATSLVDRNLDSALLLAANGAAQSPSAETEAGLLSVLDAAASLESARDYPGPAGVDDVAFADRGIVVGFHPDDNTIRSFDLATDEPAGPAIDVDYEAGFPELSVSDDGSTIIMREASGFGAWNLATGERLVSGLGGDRLSLVAWLSAQGTYIVMFDFVLATFEVFSIPEDRSLGMVNEGGPDVDSWAAISDDESTLYITGAPRVQNSTGLYSTYSLPDLTPIIEPTSLDFIAQTAVPNFNQSVVAIASWIDAAVTIVDPETLEALAPTTPLNAGRLELIEWSPSSSRLVAGTLTGEFVVISSTGSVEGRFVGRASAPKGAGWIDDDRVAVVYDDTIMTFNLELSPPLAQQIEPSAASAVGYSDAQRDGTYVINLGSQLEVVTPTGDRSRVQLGRAVHNDCGRISLPARGDFAVLSCSIRLPGGDETAGYAVVDIERGVVVHEPIALREGVFVDEIAIRNDGEVVVIAGRAFEQDASVLQVVEVATGSVIAERLDLDVWTISAAEWTDDQQLLAGGQEGNLLFLDDESLEVEDSVPLTDFWALSDITFDVAGEVAVVATEAGEVWRVDLDSRTTVGDPFVGAASQFQQADISPSGSRIAAAGRDGRIRVWDAESGAIIGSPIAGGNASNVRFIDDDTLLSSRLSGGSQLWDIGINEMIDAACRLAGRTLTEAELTLFADDLNGDVCLTR